MVLKIPLGILKNIPDRTLSIADLLRTQLPLQPSVLVTTKANAAFSQLPPNENATALENRPIPNAEYLKDLEASFGQAWFDGARSIVDSRNKNSRFPLWALTYWKQMSEVISKKGEWKRAEAWLTTHSRPSAGTVGAADEVSLREMMQCIGWGGRVHAFAISTPVDTFLRLLSDEWYEDDLINMLLGGLAAATDALIAAGKRCNKKGRITEEDEQ